MLSIGTASYPAIGGGFAAFGLYYPFALAFLAIPVGLLVLFSLHNPEPHNEQNLKDYFSAVFSRLRKKEVIALIATSLMTFIILFGARIFFLPILMGDRFGAPVYLRGAILSGASLTTALTSIR